MKDLLKSALVAAVVSVLTAVVVMSLVGNQSDSNSKELAELVQEELGRSTSFAQVKSGDLIRFSKNLPVGNGTQLALQRNTTGHTIYIDPMNTQILGNERASSSGRIFIATSSDGVTIGGLWPQKGGGYYAYGSTTVPGTALPFAPALDGLLIATNTDSNFATGSVAALKFIQDAIIDVTNDGSLGLIPVLPLEYVAVLFVEGEIGHDPTHPCGNASDGPNLSICDGATSTAWGKIDVFVEFVATTTLKDF